METCHDNQSEILITVFVLICIAFIFGMEVPWIIASATYIIAMVTQLPWQSE